MNAAREPRFPGCTLLIPSVFDTTLSSIGGALADSLLEVSQNPISLTIFSILALLIISLAFAMIFPSWRDVLVRARFLEEDERPSSLLLWIVAVMLIVKILQHLYRFSHHYPSLF
jgi:hypothetical protein